MQKRFLRQTVLDAIIVLTLVLDVFAGWKVALAAPTTEKPFYEGKVLTIVTNTTAGGSTDLLARLISRQIPKFIPGNPKIVVRDMPEAAGVASGNFAYKAKPDGLTSYAHSASQVNQNILRPKGTEFYLEKFWPIYSTPIGQIIYCKPGLIKEPKDILTAKGLVFGHNAPTTATTDFFIFVKEILGFNCKMVLGYAGGAPARLAYLAGELNIAGEATNGYNTSIKPYVDRGEAVPLFQSGVLDASGKMIVREPAAPDVPTLPEFYKLIYGKEPTGPDFEVYKMLVSSRTYGKSYLLAPATPTHCVDIFVKAVIQMVKDPEFLRESEMQNPGALHFVGKELIGGYRASVTVPQEMVRHWKKVLVEKYGAQL